MKTIKIDFIGFWSNFNKRDNVFTSILSEKYNVEISDDPDFLFVSPLGKPYEYLKKDCVRILFTGEPLTPDFNLFDYAIGFDMMQCLDNDGKNRYYRYPLCFFNYERVKQTTKAIDYSKAKEILEEKKYFCNFLYGHRSAYGEREQMLEIIQRYKRVESAGTFLNNMEDQMVIPYSEKKIDFLRLCKFTIAFESISRPGFITEKVVNPFYAYSIPIYYGNPFSVNEFNSEAIINCHEFKTFEDVLNRIIEIDQDDEKYIKMLMQPKLVDDNLIDQMYEGLKEFLWRIVSQKREDAYRRLRQYIAKEHESHLDTYRRFHDSFLYKVFMKINK